MSAGLMSERFVKVYPQGWKTIVELSNDAVALRLYAFLADQAGHENALVATYATLAAELEISERTIRRAVRRLEEGEHLVVLKLGTTCVYVLNPDEVWKTKDEHKRFCSFRTRALVPFADNPMLKRRLTHAVGQRSLPLASSEDDAK